MWGNTDQKNSKYGHFARNERQKLQSKMMNKNIQYEKLDMTIAFRKSNSLFFQLYFSLGILFKFYF